MLNPTTPKGQLIFYKWLDKTLENPFLDFEIQRLRKGLTTREITAVNEIADVEHHHAVETLYSMLFVYYAAIANPSKGNVYNALLKAPNKKSFTHDWVKQSDETFTLINHHLMRLRVDALVFHPRMLYSALALSDLLLK